MRLCRLVFCQARARGKAGGGFEMLSGIARRCIAYVHSLFACACLTFCPVSRMSAGCVSGSASGHGSCAGDIGRNCCTVLNVCFWGLAQHFALYGSQAEWWPHVTDGDVLLSYDDNCDIPLTLTQNPS